MKQIKMMALLFSLVLMSACDDGGDGASNTIPIVDETTGVFLTLPTDEEVIEALDGLDIISHVTIEQNQLILMDVKTGESRVRYELDAHEVIGQVWDLGEGYYAVWGGISGYDDEGFVVNDFRLMILDEHLTLLETLTYDDELPELFVSVLRLVDGELFVYGPAFNENWDTEPMTDFLRINVHTGEVDVLFEIEDSLQLYDFISNDHILVFEQIVDWSAGRVHTNYGILDVETGDTQLFERQGFAHGSVDFHGSKVLITESHVTTEVEHGVIIFNLDDLSSTFIQMEDEESMWARFSYDGNHIVTVNEAELVFRKYDFNGEMIVEIPIELPMTVTGVDEIPEDELYYQDISYGFAIFPVMEGIYALHIQISFGDIGLFLSDHHIQIITLP